MQLPWTSNIRLTEFLHAVCEDYLLNKQKKTNTKQQQKNFVHIEFKTNFFTKPKQI